MRTILAIDDKQDNLVTISALLNNLIADCRVLTARTARDGIDIAAAERPDTIVLDVKMPGMDGFEACGILKSMPETRHIPIILLTAIKTDVESRIRGLELGADAFLTKPIDETELIAQINVMLRIKKAEDMLRHEKDILKSLVQERTAELAESESSLMKERDFIRKLDDASPAYYVALDASGRVILMNRSFLGAVGCALDEVKGIEYASSFVPESGRELFDRAFSMLASFEIVPPYESAVLARDGREILVEWHGRSLAGLDGRIEFVFFVGIDITERRRLERLIMSDNERERNRIGQNLHDGLGQHLAAMAFKGEILRLKMKERAPEAVQEIEGIMRLVTQAINLTRDLARGLCPVDLSGGGLRSAFEELKAEVEKNFLANCLLEYDASAGPSGEIEATNLYYIAREAVNNAARHGNAKNIVIEVHQSEESFSLRVSDDGVGIPEGADERGGMGLRIMKYRAWLIGATIAISRRQGAGTVVECTLRSDGAKELSPPDEPAGGAIIESGSGGRAGIMVVDDHPIVREGLVQIINREQDLFVCGEARNADEAIRLVSRADPRLAVVDLSLGGTSGIELIRAIRARYPNIPCLVLSIHDETLYAERALRAGARGYVMKQEAPQTVVEAIRTILQGKQYMSEKVRDIILSRISHDEQKGGAHPVDSLSDREYEIFQLIGRGMSNKHIAENLCISVKTVENFRERIKSKLNFESSSELVRFAVDWVIHQGKE